MAKERGLAGVQKATSSSHGVKSSGTFPRSASCLIVTHQRTEILQSALFYQVGQS